VQAREGKPERALLCHAVPCDLCCATFWCAQAETDQGGEALLGGAERCLAVISTVANTAPASVLCPAARRQKLAREGKLGGLEEDEEDEEDDIFAPFRKQRAAQVRACCFGGVGQRAQRASAS
jgi:hypothetical protein